MQDERHDKATWNVDWKVEKFEGDVTAKDIASGLQPYEVVEGKDNLLMYGGVSNLWECLIGNGTGTASQTLTFFNNGNAHIGVGDSTTAEAATHTDLQAASNKTRKAMEATYPTHTDGVVVGSATITFRSLFGSGDANFAWQEWAVFNASTGGRMLNRKVASLGTKTSAATWQMTVTITLA
jgi:hypothetical protein